MADKKKKKPASLGCLFWIAFILLVIILFFFKRDTINGVIEKTGLVKLFTQKKQTTELTETKTDSLLPAINTVETPAEISVTAPVAGDGSNVIEPTPTPAPEKPAVKQETKKAPKPTPAQTAKKVTKPAAKTPTEKPETVKPAPTRKSSIFFVIIDEDGRVIRKEVTREIPVSDSPLSETLKALFKGTNSTEAGKGLRSLIPQGTRLLSATVKDGNATLNLSEEFQFNQFGIEGYLGQLSQIVFTATSFPSVKSVQFLIEGQRYEYLGAEGVWIGTPLSRDKF